MTDKVLKRITPAAVHTVIMIMVVSTGSEDGGGVTNSNDEAVNISFPMGNCYYVKVIMTLPTETHELTDNAPELMSARSCVIDSSSERTSGGSDGCLFRRSKLTCSPWGVTYSRSVQSNMF